MSKKKTPAIRFKGFTDDWEQRLLENEININSGKDYKHLDKGTIPVYGTGGYLLSVNQALSDNQDAIGIGRKGTINKPYILPAPFWTVDTLFYAIPIKQNNLQFFLEIFKKIDWSKKDESTGVPSLSKTSIKKTTILVPALKEQQKIGQYFKALDNLITLHQRKCEKLKIFKKAMLEKMFPKNNKKIPEVRFEGFTDAWEQEQLENIGYFSKGKGYSKNNLQTKGIPIILYGRLYTQYQTLIRDVNTFVTPNNNSIYSIGNEVLIPASGETAEEIARASAIMEPDIIIGGDLNIIYPYDNIHSPFLAYIISYGPIQKKLSQKAQGKTIVHLHNYDLKKIHILFPSIKEQVKITSFLIKLDNLITLHQRKVEKLQIIKKSMLEKMFV